MDTPNFENLGTILADLDKQLNNVETDKYALYDELKEVLKKFDAEEQNFEILWHLAKAAYKAASSAEAASDKKKAYTLLVEGEKYANKAIKLNAESSDAHSWKAFICGKLSDHLGTKERIGKGKEMQYHLEKAIELKPNENLYFAHGRWAMEVAKLNWVERKIASTLFDKVPEATYDDAIKSFESCRKIKPNWKSNLYYLGKCLVAQKKYKEAIVEFDKAIDCNIFDDEDKVNEKDLVVMQKKYASYR